MRTEDDIRAALTSLEQQAPDPRDVLAPLADLPPRRPARPRTLVAVAAATALAVAVPVVAVTALQRSGEPTAPGAWPGPGDLPSERWQFAFSVATPAGWKPLHRAIGDLFLTDMNSQSAMLQTRSGPTCTVTVYRPGAFDLRRIPAERTRIEVNGRPGYVADVRPFGSDGQDTVGAVDANGNPLPAAEQEALRKTKLRSLVDMKPVPPGPSVVWRYARDAWALSTCDEFPPRRDRDAVVADERKLAEATMFGLSPLRVPFTIGELPHGWSAYQISLEGLAFAGWPQPDIWLNLKPASATSGTLLERGISVLFTKGAPATPRPGSSLLAKIDGRHAWMNKERTAITIQGRGFELRVQGQRGDALLAIARGLKLAPDPLDESTWFDGTVAIP